MENALTLRDIRRSDARRRYMYGHPVMLCLAISAAIGGIMYLAMPDILAEASIGVVLPRSLERLWSLLYALGGASVLVGFWRLDARYEVFGLIALAGCYAAYSYAIFANRGFAGAGVFALVGPGTAGVGMGCAARAYLLRYEPEVAPWRRRRRS